jgi:hypothetical protein
MRTKEVDLSFLHRIMQIGVSVLLAAAALGATSDATAQEEDGARFRGGVRGQGGVLIAPDPGETLPAVGVQGHLGAQVNDLVGVYAAPSMDIIFGDVGGVNLASAVLVDFTFDDTWQVGVGPDVGVFAAIGGDSSSVSGAGGALYGGRLHFAAFPVVGEGEDGIRRKGLAVGLDVRMLVGDVGFATVSTSGSTASASTFLLSPMAFIGYEAF